MSKKILIIKNYIKYKYLIKFNNRKTLEKFQDRSIKKHLKFITSNSLFYKSYSNCNLEDFPIINKKIMMDNFDRLNTVNIKKNLAFETAINAEKTRAFNETLNGVSVGLSSGTSGHRGIFIITDKEKYSWAGYIASKFISLSKKKSKIAFFMRADNNLYQSIKSKKIDFTYFDMYKPIDENLKKLNEFQPSILTAPPSFLLIIANAQNNKTINISPQKIISIAEVLEKSDEEFIKKTFSHKIIHQVYQCTEGFLACTCEHGTLHLNEDIIKVEKEYISKNKFIPIITDFQRTSQPIIRYRLNDILLESTKPCLCGSVFTPLEKIEGREDDIFIFRKNGENIKVFPDFIRRCFLFVDGVDQYKVIQEINQEITIMFDGENDIKKLIKNEFFKLSNDLNFDLPKITFKAYEHSLVRKLKRVERKMEEYNEIT